MNAPRRVLAAVEDVHGSEVAGHMYCNRHRTARNPDAVAPMKEARGDRLSRLPGSITEISPRMKSACTSWERSACT
jgi:hypothetical protein